MYVLKTWGDLGDKVRFKQVFFNLLSNAIKFTPAYGTVTFSIRNETVCNGVTRTTFRVADSGIGMSKEFLERMFEPFTQEQNAFSSKTRGSGLGLAIVKSIVGAMGGTIDVESALEHGTTFTIRLELPVVEDAAEAEPSPEPDIDFDILSGKNILLAEDHPLNVEIAEYLLLKAGAVVTCAENGRRALEAFLDTPPWHFDAILMDIQMPEMDGLEAAKRIRDLSREDAAHVPIIAMTANAFDDDVKKSIQSGMNRHLTKPIVPSMLYETLACLIKSGESPRL